MKSLEESREMYKNGYYSKQLEVGLEFQDFVMSQLYKQGIPVLGYASRRYQNECGENMFGAEIKRDGRFRDTGNLYIEIAEKSHPDRPSYTDSGIMRKDNSWLFVIGDEQTFWVFSIKYLQAISSRYHQVESPTSIAYLMPLKDADKYCLFRWSGSGGGLKECFNWSGTPPPEAPRYTSSRSTAIQGSLFTEPTS